VKAETEVSLLQRRIQGLEQELVQKEAVIRELHTAAEERLAIIQGWSGTGKDT
jgi:hypothetical protein